MRNTNTTKQDATKCDKTKRTLNTLDIIQLQTTLNIIQLQTTLNITFHEKVLNAMKAKQLKQQPKFRGIPKTPFFSVFYFPQDATKCDKTKRNSTSNHSKYKV